MRSVSMLAVIAPHAVGPIRVLADRVQDRPVLDSQKEIATLEQAIQDKLVDRGELPEVPAFCLTLDGWNTTPRQLENTLIELEPSIRTSWKKYIRTGVPWGSPKAAIFMLIPLINRKDVCRLTRRWGPGEYGSHRFLDALYDTLVHAKAIGGSVLLTSRVLGGSVDDTKFGSASNQPILHRP